jgi:hypothetical protein
MASERAKKAAAARLKGLDKAGDKERRANARTKAAYGDRKTRKKATKALGEMSKPPQFNKNK